MTGPRNGTKSERGRSQAKRLAVALAVAFVVALVTYPVLIPDVGWEPDQSWAAALHMAHRQGLVFGRDVVFTYGPLGWLSTATMFYENTGAVAIGIRFPILMAVAFVIWCRLRSLCSWPLAALGCVALSWMIGSVLLIGGEAPLLVLFAVLGPYLWRLATPDAAALPRWAPAALGAVAGVMMLVKFDVGLSLTAWTLFVVFAESVLHRLGWRRILANAAWALDGFLSALIIGWLLCGQPLSALTEWLSLSFNLFAGFNDAMARSGPAWELQLAFASMAGIVVLVRQRSVALEARRSRLLWLALGASMFVFAKQAFLRHDSHSLRWWAFVGVVVLALAVRKTVTMAAFLVVPSVIIVGSVVGSLAFTDPAASIRSANRALGQVTSHAERRQVRSWGRYILPKTYPLPADIVKRIQGQTLHIGPVRSVVSWIYPKTTWRPFPILQHYHGFTPRLDRWTADFVRGPRAPKYVLYEQFTIDNRIGRWDPPETMLALVCRYRFVSGTDAWQLFERRSTNACGARRRIDVVDGRIGEELYTPLGDENEIVVGAFSGPAFSPGLVGRVRALVTRPSTTDVVVQNDPKRHRFIAGTAGQDHLLVLPSCLQDQMAGFDSATMRSLTFQRGSGPLRPGAALSGTYDAITYNCDAP